MTSVVQVQDKIDLLYQMMDDMEKADECYNPTNYWAFYERKFIPELEKKGLKDFRRRKKSVLQSFGAIDLWPYAEPAYTGKVRGFNRFVKILFKVLQKCGVKLNLDYNPEGTTKYYLQQVKNKFEKYSLDISKCSMSRNGNPEGFVEVNSAFWSLAHLRHCSLFIDSYEHICFQDSMVYCELGSGIGRSVESLAQLYENATFILFDIPPQLYVANQYLSSIFEDRVIKYEDAIKLDPKNGMLERIKGKIVMLPTWSMPAWKNVKIDVFWNSASFSEMEPEAVKNYLICFIGLCHSIYENIKTSYENIKTSQSSHRHL